MQYESASIMYNSVYIYFYILLSCISVYIYAFQPLQCMWTCKVQYLITCVATYIRSFYNSLWTSTDEISKLAQRTIRAFRKALNDLGLKCAFYLTQSDGTLISDYYIALVLSIHIDIVKQNNRTHSQLLLYIVTYYHSHYVCQCYIRELRLTYIFMICIYMHITYAHLVIVTHTL